jgi:alpha-L-fucosidase
MQVNQECIYSVRPWVITNEQNIWFTKAKNEDTLYAIVKQQPRWVRGQWRDVVLRSVAATDKTQVSVLGQNGRVLEYRSDVNPAPTFQQQAGGLHIRAMFTHRLQDNSRWPNPIVLKITNVKPAFTPPRLETSGAKIDRSRNSATLEGLLTGMGGASSLEVGFEYRSILGLDASDRSIPWQPGPSTTVTAPGRFSLEVGDLNPQGIYEYRAWVKHPVLTIFGEEKRLSLR